MDEIDRDLARGVLSPAEAERVRVEVSRRLLDADRAATAAPAAQGGPGAIAGVVTGTLVAALALGGYAWLGAPDYPDQPRAARLAMAAQTKANRPSQAEAEAGEPAFTPPPGTDPDYLELMEKLRATVATRPDDLQGWTLLARNEAQLGNFRAAYLAQARMIALKKDKAPPGDLAELANLMILAARGYVSPQAEEALDHVLVAEPKNPVARYYTGLLFAQTGRPDLGVPAVAAAAGRKPARRALDRTDPRPDRHRGGAGGDRLHPAARRGGTGADRGRRRGGRPDERHRPLADDLDDGRRAGDAAGRRWRAGVRLGQAHHLAGGDGQPRPRPVCARRRPRGLCHRCRGTGRDRRGGGGSGAGPVIHDRIQDFAAALPRGAALAGIDLGTRTIGVAVSDRLRQVASPLETIRRTRFTADAGLLLALMAGRQIGGLVLGLPLNMDGSEGPRCQSTRAFARNLARLDPVAMTFWDERLSTVAAERALLEADTSRKRRAEVIDHVAAGYILQGALDRLRHLERNA